jgi:hypothetical protein
MIERGEEILPRRELLLTQHLSKQECLTEAQRVLASKQLGILLSSPAATPRRGVDEVAVFTTPHAYNSTRTSALYPFAESVEFSLS